MGKIVIIELVFVYVNEICNLYNLEWILGGLFSGLVVVVVVGYVFFVIGM